MYKQEYIFIAKPELLQKLGEDHYLSCDMILRLEGSLYPYKTEIEEQKMTESLILKTKLEFLLYIIVTFRRYPRRITLEDVEILFGSPPEFSIDNLDKWWTIRRLPHYIRTPWQIYLASTSADIAQLHTQGYPDLELISRIYYEDKKKEEDIKSEVDNNSVE